MVPTLPCLASALLALTAAAPARERSFLAQAPLEQAPSGAGALAADGDSALGKECWFSCGEQAGFCTWCGRGNACCNRLGHDLVPECEITDGFLSEDEEGYQCVKSTSNIPLLVDSAIYGSIGVGSQKIDATDKVNELIAKNGIMDFTARTELNVVFGDPVPGVAKVLSIQKGEHMQEFREMTNGGPEGNLYNLAPFMHAALGATPPFVQPSVFVAVFSRRVAETRRSLIRDMWSRAVGHSGRVTVKFVLCKARDDLEFKVEAEQGIHGDLLLLHCQEGEDEGKLTQKVFLAMKEFKNSKPSRQLFMKLDDDTFVAWRRFSAYLLKKANAVTYAGVPVVRSAPCRNPQSKIFEPVETFPGDAYPRTMSSGAGFVLGKTLVQSILDEGIPAANFLWNQERAVAVWVDELVQRNVPVEYLPVPGSATMNGWQTVWKDYPYFLHHGLHGVTISCLALADESGDPWHEIRNCFDVEASDEIAEEPSC